MPFRLRGGAGDGAAAMGGIESGAWRQGIAIERLEVAPQRRILVTSDVHGHLAHLKSVLAQAHFGGDDLLVIAGDLLEKGPEVLATLRYAMELGRTHAVICLAGNVDLSRVQLLEVTDPAHHGDIYAHLQRLRHWPSNLFDEMAAEMGVVLRSPADFTLYREAMLARFEPELNFLRSMPAILETQRFIFVHGGLPTPNLVELVGRDVYDVLAYPLFYNIEQRFDKYVVVGHMPVMLYDGQIPQHNPLIDHRRRIISLDGGCGLKEDGQLNLLILPNIDCRAGEISWVHYDGLPVYEALTAQAASPDSVNIRWGDLGVRVLEPGTEYTLVEHVSSGRRLWVENAYLTPEGTALRGDYTDYRLPVRPGDELSLVRSTDRGHFVKRNGVAGWYRGELRRK